MKMIKRVNSLVIFTLVSVGNGFTVLSRVSKSSSISLHHGNKKTCAGMSSNSDDNTDFWTAQKKLAESMSESAANSERMSIQLTEKQKYNKRVNNLVSETFYFSVMIFSAIWFLSPNPFTALSYFLGALLGTAYCYGLGKYVETLGGSAYDVEDVKGSGVGSARFAFLIVLFIFVGKFRSEGLQEIPAIMGFFTYQISSLSQGLKDAAE